jgi:hypothetical protein
MAGARARGSGEPHGVSRHGHRSALGTGPSGLGERPRDLCDRPERLKGRVRRDTDVEPFLPPSPSVLSGTGVRGVWGRALHDEEDFFYIS